MWGDKDGAPAGLGPAQIKGRGRSGPGRRVWSRDLSQEESRGGCCSPDPFDWHSCQPFPAPLSPGLEQQQREEKEGEQGCPTGLRTRSVSPTGTLCGAQPHPHKAELHQALPGSLPVFPSKPRGLWGLGSVPQ